MRRFSWFVLVKCVDYPIRMRHFSSRAIALGANFANKEIGRFTSRKWPSKWKKNVKKGYRAVRRFLAFFGDP